MNWSDPSQYAHLSFEELYEREDVDWPLVLFSRKFTPEQGKLIEWKVDVDLWRLMRDPATECPCSWFWYCRGEIELPTDLLDRYWHLLNPSLVMVYVRLTAEQLCHFSDRIDMEELDKIFMSSLRLPESDN